MKAVNSVCRAARWTYWVIFDLLDCFLSRSHSRSFRYFIKVNQPIILIHFIPTVSQIFNYTIWVSARRKSGSPESTEPDMVPLFVRLPERWKSPSTLHTTVCFAEKTLSSALVLEFGIADHATRLSLVVHTLCRQLARFKHAVTSID